MKKVMIVLLLILSCTVVKNSSNVNIHQEPSSDQEIKMFNKTIVKDSTQVDKKEQE